MNRHWRRVRAGAMLFATVLTACVSTAPREPAREPPAAPAAQPVQPPTDPGLPADPSRRSAIGSPGNPPFYDVLGERYHVLADSAGYRQRGVASWYGREFHGKRTSSGEVYDMYGLTAAHKTLPLPTTARVTNLANGKSVLVRVNDRGPFSKNRLIDMSYAAARELGMLAPGTTMVEVEALPDRAAGSAALVEPRFDGQQGPAQPSASPGRMYVQVGAFGESQNAEALKRRLHQHGLSNVVVRYDARSAPALYRVHVGPIAGAREYDAVVGRVSAMQIRNPQLIVEPAGADWSAPSSDSPGPPGG
jgi:rare lipoprotein A